MEAPSNESSRELANKGGGSSLLQLKQENEEQKPHRAPMASVDFDPQNVPGRRIGGTPLCVSRRKSAAREGMK